MATGAFCGIAPLLFRRKSSGLQVTKISELSKNKKQVSEVSKNKKQLSDIPKNKKQVEGVKMADSPRKWTGNFILMMELRKKTLVFRDIIDLLPFDGSSSINELLLGTTRDLQKLFPEIIPNILVSETEGTSTEQALVYFCGALKSIGYSWMKNNETAEFKYNANMDNCGFEQLVKEGLEILDCMIKAANERFDKLDIEDLKKEDCSPRGDPFARSSIDSYSSSCCLSPMTPTSVLPEVSIGKSTQFGEFVNIGYDGSTLMPLRAQALGKLNPIDVKRLSFHMFPHVLAQDPRTMLQGEKTDGEEKQEHIVKSMSEVAVIKEENMICEFTQLVAQKPLPPPLSLPKISIHVVAPPMTPLPPPPIPSLKLQEIVNVAMPSSLPPPSSKLQQAATVTIPSPPPTPRLQEVVSVTIPSPPPPLSPKLQQAVTVTIPCPPPPPPPSPRVLINVIVPPSPSPLTTPIKGLGPSPMPRTNRVAPPPPLPTNRVVPPPPPPMMATKGSVPPSPPPMTPKVGGAQPPPPPGPARTLHPKTTATKLKRSTHMGNLYRILKGKVEGSCLTGKSTQGKKSQNGASGGSSQGMADALAEMTRRSAYFIQIEEDVQKYTKLITELKTTLSNFQTKDMSEVLKFHKHVESQLENLTDESQVLARFVGFPIKKLEALRMAAALYLKLDAILTTLMKWKIEAPLNQLLDKAESYFNKIKGELDALERTKDEESKKFKSHKIEFDFHILVKIKESMVDVSSGCMELALKEGREAKTNASNNVQSKSLNGGVSKIGSAKMLWKAFQFAFRVYTFAGGQDDRADMLSRELAQEIEIDNH